jgi:acyl carrier protein
VRSIVASKTTGPVSTDSTFDSLGLDSLAMAEVVFEIESAFRIHADAERLLDMRSIGEVSTYVVQEVKKKQATHGRLDRPTSAEIRPG